MSINFYSSLNQDAKAWYLCYHNIKLPVTTFVHLDDVTESHEFLGLDSLPEGPKANSTFIEHRLHNSTDPSIRHSSIVNSSINIRRNDRETSFADDYTNSVGHMSHIPRTAPKPSTFTVPSIKSTRAVSSEENLFGMIKLGDNDVCYTSGTIEWIGRKRSYPLNSGFKLISENCSSLNKTKIRKLNETITGGADKPKECDCADVLPTVNAIVDHLNAIHEAVDLVDLRLTTIEGVMSKN